MSSIFFATCSIVCLLLWAGTRPRISPQSLISRAEQWDSAGPAHETTGVLYQKVRISSSDEVVERPIYRDLAGKRRQKHPSLAAHEQELKAKLALAGVDWDRPLAVQSFREWHDRQHVTRDSIDESEDHLLTLTSRADPEGLITEETLTVRESDFHPVRRSIDIRGAGTVEVAELEYDVIPWNVAAPEWFEPVPTSTVTPAPNLHPSIARAISEADLDLADLSVRLALNQLGADSGERITSTRLVGGIQVQGIVATDQRKREIEAMLSQIPHVLPAISTFDEAQNRSATPEVLTHIEAVSDSMQVAPFEEYLFNSGSSRELARQQAEDLLDSSLTIDQDSRAVVKLLHDFNAQELRTPAEQSLFNQLLTLHCDKILAAIRTQQTLLIRSGRADSSANSPPSVEESPSTPDEMGRLADRNLVISKSLSHGEPLSSASVENLLDALARSSLDLDVLTRRIVLNLRSDQANQRLTPPNTSQPR